MVLRDFTALCVVVAAQILASLVTTYLNGFLENRYTQRLRAKFSEALRRMDYRSLEQISDGDLIAMSTNDIEATLPCFCAVLTVPQIPVFILLPLFLMYRASIGLTLLLLPLMMLSLVPTLLLTKNLHALNVCEKEAYTEQGLKSMPFLRLVYAEYRDWSRLNRGKILSRYGSDSLTSIRLITYDLFAVVYLKRFPSTSVKITSSPDERTFKLPK